MAFSKQKISTFCDLGVYDKSYILALTAQKVQNYHLSHKDMMRCYTILSENKNVMSKYVLNEWKISGFTCGQVPENKKYKVKVEVGHKPGRESWLKTKTLNIVCPQILPQTIFSYIHYVTYTETIKSPDKPLGCFLLLPLKYSLMCSTVSLHVLSLKFKKKFLMQYSSKNDPSHFMGEENKAQPSYAGSRVLWEKGWARGLSLKNLMLLETWFHLP